MMDTVRIVFRAAVEFKSIFKYGVKNSFMICICIIPFFLLYSSIPVYFNTFYCTAFDSCLVVTLRINTKNSCNIKMPPA